MNTDGRPHTRLHTSLWRRCKEPRDDTYGFPDWTYRKEPRGNGAFIFPSSLIIGRRGGEPSVTMTRRVEELAFHHPSPSECSVAAGNVPDLEDR